MKQTITILLTLFAVSMAQAGRAEKIFDGTQAYCPSDVSSSYLSTDKFIRTHVSGGNLVVQASNCVHGKWVLDTNLKSYKYTSVTGVRVTENYSNFVLVVRSMDWTRFKQIKLSNFQNNSIARIPLSSLKSVATDKVDVNLQSDVRTRGSNGYDFLDSIEWGQTRITLK